MHMYTAILRPNTKYFHLLHSFYLEVTHRVRYLIVYFLGLLLVCSVQLNISSVLYYSHS